MYKIKNIALVLITVFSSVRRLFFDTGERVHWYIFKPDDIPNGIRIDFMLYYWTVAINFLILAYCVKYNRGLNSIVVNFVLTLSIIDIFHLILYAGRGFECFKILAAIIIVGLSNLQKWQR